MEKMTNKILVVEDDLCQQTILTRIFHSIDVGLEVVWVTSAEEALRCLERDSFQLIFADCYLDGKSTGFDLWDFCRNEYPDTPVLLTSGMGVETFFKLVGSNQVAPAYIPKPFYAGECRQYLQSLLAGARNGSAVL